MCSQQVKPIHLTNLTHNLHLWGIAIVLIAAAAATAADKKKPAKLTTEDHLNAVLEKKDAQSLWLLMRRSALRRITHGDKELDVNIDTTNQMIQGWSESDDYRAAAQKTLNSLNVPRDWKKETLELAKKFKQYHPHAIVFETRYYYVLSTADPKITKELAVRMDAIFQMYDKLFGFKEKIPYKCIVKFWKDRNEYLKNGAPPGSAAYYSPSTKELVGYNTKALRATDHMDPYESMFHEGWHQYFDFYIPGSPRWFDEGFAEVFSATDVSRSRVRLGRNTYQARYAAHLLKENRLIPIRRLIRMNHKSFMSQSDVTYAQSYSFITFLMNFKSGNRQLQNAVRQFYKDYFWELRKGTNPEKAVDIVFGNVRLEVLEDLWKKSVRRQR